MLYNPLKLNLHSNLKKVRNLLSDESRWTKSGLAKSKSGKLLLSANLEEAYAFCTVGAIHKVANEKESEKYERSRAMILRILDHLTKAGHHSIVSFNDSKTTTHAMLLEMLDEVIDNLWYEIQNEN